MNQQKDRIMAKPKPLDQNPFPSEETTRRVYVQGTTVITVHEVQANTLILASADFGDARASLDGAPPEEVASRLPHALAETAMAQDVNPSIPDNGSPQQRSWGRDHKSGTTDRCARSRSAPCRPNDVAAAPLQSARPPSA